MVYTGERATAEELHRHGSVLRVVERDALRAAAREVAAGIAAKSPTVIRAAKQSLNGIDPVDVNKSYRFEQGFTFELNLSGVSDEARRAFVEKRREPAPGAREVIAMIDKRMTEAEVVAELRDGMTIGIGGWGSRRKPMSLVRAILRSPLKDLTIVSYGGPDVGLLCAAGKVKKLVYGFVSLDSIPLEPHFRAARQAGADRGDGARRGHAPVGPLRRLAAAALPADARRARVRRAPREPRHPHRAIALRRRGGARRRPRHPARRGASST